MGLFDDLIPQAEPRARITVNPAPRQAMPAESFQSNPRGFTVNDVQAAMRGDMLNAPGLPIKYEAQPGQTFGVDATRNAQPFQNVVAHHTGGPTLQGALDTARRGDPFRSDVKYGYHFYIDTDGTVVQGAPLDARTNHVQPPGAAQRTARPDISNNNSIGVSFVGAGSNPTPEQLAAAQNLTRALQSQYGIAPENVVGHGEIQSNRQTSEGMPLVNAIRNGAQVAAAPADVSAQSRITQAFSSPGIANAALPREEAPQRPGMFADLIPKRAVGRGEAAAVGAVQGITANFGDELAGAKAAAGLPSAASRVVRSVPMVGAVAEPLIGAARLGYEYLTGGNEASGRYEGARDRFRNDAAAAQEQHPGYYLAGNVGGALALPGGGMLNAATVPARLARGAAVGAAYGGASGSGDGTDAASRIAGGLTGAGTGAVVGTAAVPALGAVEALGRGVAAAFRPATSAIRGAIDPEREAARRVVTAIERDARGAGTELTPQEFAAARAAGNPVAIQELGGETTRALARSAANSSPEARATLQNLADQRFEGQTDRAATFIRNIAGVPTDSGAVRESLQSAARAANAPAYAKAYRNPNAQGMWDEGFEQIAQAPVVQNAIRAASVTGANRGTIEGLSRGQSPFVIDRATGQLTLRSNPDGSQMLPNLQFWDHVKRNLDKINTPEAKTLNSALKQHLDDLVPDYKAARAGAARFFDADDAMKAGENFVRGNMPMADARRAFASMSPAEKDAFRIGFVSKFLDDISRTGDRVNVFGRIANTPRAREQLQMVVGPNGYRQLEALQSVEQSIDRLRGALGNSTTVRQMVELGLAGGIAGSGLYNTDPTQIALAGAIAGRRWVDQRVAKKVADMLTSNDPNVLAKGIGMVASNKSLSAAFRELDTKLARVGTQQAPAVQIPGAGRAEDENSVPGPVRQ